MTAVPLPDVPPGSTALRPVAPGEVARWQVCEGEAYIVLGIHPTTGPWVRVDGPIGTGPGRPISWDVRGRLAAVATAITTGQAWLADWARAIRDDSTATEQGSLFEEGAA